MADKLDKNINPQALQKKYEEERIKRVNNVGLGQYRPAISGLTQFADDPYTESDSIRTPVDATYDVVIVGGGWSGLVIAGQLVKQGIGNVLIVEKANDFGGAWLVISNLR